MMSTYGWIIDTALILLLSSTFVMALRLDRALRIVRRDRAAFEALISSLSSATNAVKLGIQKLRDEAERSAEHIERRSNEADRMATDLSFLIERAEGAGGRLEAGLRGMAAIAPGGRGGRDAPGAHDEAATKNAAAGRPSPGTRRRSRQPAPARAPALQQAG
jgi:hypothetical protein